MGGYIPNELGDAEQIFAAAGIGGVSSFAAGGSFLHGAMAGGFGRAFNHALHPMTRAFRSILKDQYRITPRELTAPARNGYNKFNSALHDPRTGIAVKTYIGVATTTSLVLPLTAPILTPTLGPAILLNNYLDTMPVGSSLPEWK